MRTHAEIIKAAGGAAVVHDRLAMTGKLNTVRSWVQRDRIPAEFFADFVAAGLSTFEELGMGARALRATV